MIQAGTGSILVWSEPCIPFQGFYWAKLMGGFQKGADGVLFVVLGKDRTSSINVAFREDHPSWSQDVAGFRRQYADTTRNAETSAPNKSTDLLHHGECSRRPQPLNTSIINRPPPKLEALNWPYLRTCLIPLQCHQQAFPSSAPNFPAAHTMITVLFEPRVQIQVPLFSSRIREQSKPPARLSSSLYCSHLSAQREEESPGWTEVAGNLISCGPGMWLSCLGKQPRGSKGRRKHGQYATLSENNPPTEAEAICKLGALSHPRRSFKALQSSQRHIWIPTCFVK